MFGTQAAGTAPANPFPFGTSRTTATTTTTAAGFQLGTFCFSTAGTTATAPTTTVAAAGLGGFGLTAAPSSAASAPPASSAPASGPGLGGFTISGSTTSGVPGQAGNSGVQKPRDTQLPPDLITLVEALRKHIKSNKEHSDGIDGTSLSHVKCLEDEMKNSSQYLRTVGKEVQRLVAKGEHLKAQSRQDLRQAELVQRRNEAIPTHHYATTTALELQPVWHLHVLASAYEEQLVEYQRELMEIEQIIVRKIKASSGDSLEKESVPRDKISKEVSEVISHLRRMEETIRQIGGHVYGTHDLVEHAKLEFMRYRKSLHGDNVANPFSRPTSSHKSRPPKKLEGPDPFSAESYSSLLGMASTMHKNREIGVLPVTTGFLSGIPQQSAFGQQTGFGLGATGGVGPGLGTGTGMFGTAPLGQNTGPATNTASMFRPFGSGTSATTTTPSLGTAFGTAPTTTVASSVSPFRFSSPFNNASSGTLFGGSAATNLGVVKPFGR